MDERIKKVESEITGVVLGFGSTQFPVYKEKCTIIIRCESDKLPQAIEVRFNYSTKWEKLGLKLGDRVNFKAIIKSSTFSVHKTERWVDSWGHLPLDMSESLIVIEIRSPKQLSKL